MSDAAATPDEVGRIYDESSEFSDVFNDGQEHQSYWYDDRDDASIAEATRRITRRVMDMLHLRPGDHVLDVGCGLGAPAILVARETGARVTGINVSRVQVAAACRRAEASGLGNRLHFEYGDFMSLPYPDGTFDAAIAIESLLHAPDPVVALRELHRVLRPGGVLAMCESTRECEVDPDDERYGYAVRLDTMLTQADWIDALRTAGFVVEEYTQCGPRVHGKGGRVVEGIVASRDRLVAQFGAKVVDGVVQGMSAFFAVGTDHIGYAFFAARKPAPGADIG